MTTRGAAAMKHCFMKHCFMLNRLIFLGALLLCLAISLTAGIVSAQSGNLALNPGFEDDLSVGWSQIWTRDPDVAQVARVGEAHSGSWCLEVQHTGAQDWTIWQIAPISVIPGDIFELSGWIKCSGVTGDADYSVVTRTSDGSVIDWIFGSAVTSGTHDWREVKTHFVVPEDCATITLRIVGWGPGTMWFDDVSLIKEGNVVDIRGPAEHLTLANDDLQVVFHTGTSTLTATDRRTDRTYDQLLLPGIPVVLGADLGEDGRSLTARLWEPSSDLQLQLHLTIPTSSPELRCELTATGPMSREFAYPAPFRAGSGDLLVIPMNEGILYPADDSTVSPIRLVGYSGHGISMAWFGQAHGETGPGVMAIIETPNDMSILIDRPAAQGNADLTVWPIWEPSRGELAYARAITYVFLDSGGYVSQAKRYRQYAKDIGLYKSLRQKLAENPNVDLLIGAVNVWAPTWYGNNDPLALVSEMRSLGIDRLLYSEGSSPAVVAAMNAMPGVLTSRYDIYQDVWPPDAPPWALHEGWPEDLVLLPDGSIMPGWVIRDGDTLYPGGVLCSSRGIEHARAQIPADLAVTPYRCRFIDTTTASPWRECYHPDHPLDRTQDRYWKMQLLDFVSGDMGLVTGTETGIDPSVPYVHYYEGMMSLGPYRLPDCGYTLIDYKPPTPEFLKYQVGPFYRVPLWELVYHDCTVAMWYWGDSTNKAPEVWDQRDLFNLLYGTPPLFMLSPEVWQTHKSRFVQTYQSVCPFTRRVGYDEMLSHEFLTPDHTLQRTTWSSGRALVANLSDQPQSLPDGAVVPAWGWLERGLPFSDVLPEFWAYPEIVACHGSGIVAGYPDCTYRPTAPVTRDQMAVYVARTLAGGDAAVPTGPAVATFPDVPADHWAFRYVEYAADRDIVLGYDDGTYRPSLVVDRAQMAVYVARSIVTPTTGEEGLADYVPPETPTFPDVTPETHAWCYKHVEYIAEAGVAHGYDDGTYRPAAAVTRDQMAVYITRAFHLPM